MADFHFLRPWWLLVLPFGVWLSWQLTRSGTLGSRWREFVDEALQPYVLTGSSMLFRERRTVLIAAVLAWLLTTFALAGPTWERLPAPTVRSDEALVVVLDLSRSMDAVDIEPSRLARAKFKLLALLARRESGQTGLVVFSAHAFTVAPLTSDVRTIALLVASLSSDIMPSRGSYPEAGLRKAAQLLRQTGLVRGEILLITDAQVSPESLSIAQDLYREGYTVHVLAVGTADGGPIVEPGGGFLTDQTGRVVIPRLDSNLLQRLANRGGGRFATLTVDDRDLDYLLPPRLGVAGDVADSGTTDPYQIIAWRDRGLWLVLLLIPIVALAFRRGWVVVWAVWFVLPMPQAHALTWADLWQTRDQQGQEAFRAEEHERAAGLFEDPSWQAAAQFRAGDYQDSAATLDGLETPDAQYNRGNALTGTGQIDLAIAAFERALELDPEHQDARFNRDLLLQQPPQSQSDPGDSDGQDSAENQAESSPQPPNAESTDNDQSEDAQAPEQEQSGQPSAAEQAAAEQALAQELPQGELPTPGELEEWADEQAAEQWLRRVPQDPGGLLRRKFLYQYQRLGIDQDGNFVWPGDEQQPW
jgi:Ca-activated chloride channel family protein